MEITSSNIITLLNFVGALQGLFLVAVILRTKNSKRTSKQLLAALLFTFSLYTLGTIVRCTKLLIDVPHLAETYPVLLFAFGPLLFLYVKALTKKDFRVKLAHALHFIPLFIRILYSVPIYIKSIDFKIQYLIESYKTPPPYSGFILVSAFLQAFIYLVLSTRSVIRYSTSVNLENLYEKKYFYGLRNILIALVCLWIAWIVGRTNNSAWAGVLPPLLFSILVYSIAYLAIFQSQVLGIHKEETLEVRTIEEMKLLKAKAETYRLIINYDFKNLHLVSTERKYNKSSLQDEQKHEHLSRLVLLMEKEKLYLNSDLTLQELARRLVLSPNHLSQIINELLHQNFFDFINMYRVEEIKKLLINPANKNLTILAIAFDAGFNSKATFNTAFKKSTGVTPSEYKKNYSASLQKESYRRL